MIKFSGDLSEDCKYYYLKNAQKINFFCISICLNSIYYWYRCISKDYWLDCIDIINSNNISYRNGFLTAKIKVV